MTMADPYGRAYSRDSSTDGGGGDGNGNGNGTKGKGKGNHHGIKGGFQSLGLSEEVYRGISKMGFRIPTPVQRKSLPVVLSGSDTVVMARTGSGKTAAFCIPLLERMLNSQRRKQQQQQSSSTTFSAGAVILSPTRELSLQTLKVLQTLSAYIEHPTIQCIGINGGESMEKQFALLSSNPDIIVATPGRLAHHLSEIPDFHLRHCDMVVFDEADRLFEMGFAMQIRQICSAMPSVESGRQTLLFSATMPKVLVEFTKCGIMDSDPQVVRLDKDATVSEELRIGFITVRSQEKDGALLHLLRDILPTAKMIHNHHHHDSSAVGSSKKKKKKKKKMGTKEDADGDGGEEDHDHDRSNASSLGLTLIFAATRHHVDYLTMLINNAGLGLMSGNGNGSNGGQPKIAGCIYGTMDQEARKQNLSAFRNGRVPILIVTDVAARGIDIPLIDHVIHYSFPPTAKLFVHRSGRAARASRIGYCWGLVDTEEMPYMVDLYLFLGRKLSTGQKEVETLEESDNGSGGRSKNANVNDDDDEEETMYTIDDMTPDMVHYGSIPESTSSQEVENVRRIIESELTSSHDAETLRSLVRTCHNAMKQYRRSRPEASRQGVKRAKAILEGQKGDTGQRKGGGMIPAHPILRRAEVDKIVQKYNSTAKDGEGSGKSVTASDDDVKLRLKELKQREEMLRAMSNFRPKETVFEAFATGGGKAVGILGQVDKGRTTGASKKNDTSAAFSAMKNMRRQMKLAHDKGSSMVVAGSNKALEINGDVEMEQIEAGEEQQEESGSRNATASKGESGAEVPVIKVVEKKRMSKAERKRMKKGKSPSAAINTTNTTTIGTGLNDYSQRTKHKRGADFRDTAFYIDNESSANPEESQRSQHIEAAMQPSAASGKDGVNSALRLEEAMLDIVGDENADLVKKHRVMRWDKSKRKYVQTTLGMETSGMSKTKKMKLESGQIVKSDKMKLGELYEKWQKKTKKSIGRVGVFDDVVENDDAGVADAGGYARKTSKAKSGGAGAGAGVQDDVQTATQIRKKREQAKKNKIRNMPKKERAQLFAKKRADQKRMAADAASKGKGWQGKKGFSGRYGAQVKGKL